MMVVGITQSMFLDSKMRELTKIRVSLGKMLKPLNNNNNISPLIDKET